MSNWVDTELSEQDMGDKRLDKSAKILLENLSRDAALSIPNANKTWAETQAAYRFFDNDKVNLDSIMFGHLAVYLYKYHHLTQKSLRILKRLMTHFTVFFSKNIVNSIGYYFDTRDCCILDAFSG